MAHAARRGVKLPKIAPVVPTMSNMATETQIDTAFANTVHYLEEAFGIKDVTDAEYAEFLTRILVILGHVGTSAREQYPQSAAFRCVLARPAVQEDGHEIHPAKVAGQIIEIPMHDLVGRFGVSVRRWARYYADALFDYALNSAIIFTWGATRGINQPGFGFDFADSISVTEQRFTQSNRKVLAIAKNVTLASTTDQLEEYERDVKEGIWGKAPAGEEV